MRGFGGLGFRGLGFTGLGFTGLGVKVLRLGSGCLLLSCFRRLGLLFWVEGLGLRT